MYASELYGCSKASPLGEGESMFPHPVMRRLSLAALRLTRRRFLSTRSLKPEQVQALVLTIKYDGSAIRLTTGTAFSSFVPDKTLDAQWDKTMRQFLSRKEIACRE